MSKKYPVDLGLWKKKTQYVEVEDSNYFIVEGLNNPSGYGKHKIYISVRNPKSSKLKLKQYSNIAFEIIDSKGTVIFSENAKIQNSIKSFSVISFDIREKLIKKGTKIQDGKGYLYILGTLDDGSGSNDYNIKYEKSFEIKKHIKNVDDIIFKNEPEVTMGSHVVEDLSSFKNRSGFDSTVKKYVNVSFDRLHTYSGEIDTIEVRAKSDEDSTTQYELIDSIKMNEGLEMLTPSSSKSDDTTHIGDTSKYVSAGPGYHWYDYWDYQPAIAEPNTFIRDNVYHQNSMQAIWGSPPSSTFRWTRMWADPQQATTHKQRIWWYKIIRKADDDETYRLSFNASGSGELLILESEHLDKLTDTRSGSALVNSSWSDENHPDHVNLVYEKHFTSSMDIHNFRTSIINGYAQPTPPLDLTYSDGHQMYHQDIEISSGSWFGIFLSAAPPSSGSDASASFSNISIKQTAYSGSNFGSYYKRVPMIGGAFKTEDFDFKYAYLNPDGITAYRLDTNENLVSTGSISNFAAEGIAIERGLGQGIANSQFTRSFVSRHTYIGTSSKQPVDQVIGVIAEAADDNNTITLQNNLNYISRISTPGNYDFGSGYYSVGDKQVIGLVANSVSSGSAAAIGLSVMAENQSMKEGRQWAARFEKGHVYIKDNTFMQGNLVVSGSITADSHIVSSSISYYTSSFHSGSTRFGDSADDTHVFTGSVLVNDKIYSDDLILCGSTPQLTFYETDNDSTMRIYQTGGVGKIYHQKAGGGTTAGDLEIRTYNFDSSIYIDNSEQTLGIGTDEPTEKLQVAGIISASGNINTEGSYLLDGGASGKIESFDNYGGSLLFYTGSSLPHTMITNKGMYISPASQGGLAHTADTNKTLTVHGDMSASGDLYLGTSNNGTSYIKFGDSQDDNRGQIYYKHENDDMRFSQGSYFRMGISGSGLDGGIVEIRGDISSSGNHHLHGNLSMGSPEVSQSVDGLTVDGAISCSGTAYIYGNYYWNIIFPENTAREISIKHPTGGNVDGADLTLKAANPSTEVGGNQDGGNINLIPGTKLNSGEDGKVIVSGDIKSTGLYVTSSGESVIQVGNTGDDLSKWEWHRNGVRKWMIANDGRDGSPNPAVATDALLIKHGIADDGNDHINISMKQDDQTVYFHGDISASGDIRLPVNSKIKWYDDDQYITGNANSITVESDDTFGVLADTKVVFDTPRVGINTSITELPPTALTVGGAISGSGNLYIDGGVHTTLQTFSDGDTSPSVFTGRIFKTANTSDTNITTFHNGTAGQIITVLINDAYTDFIAGTNLKLYRNLDWNNSAQNDSITFACIDGTKWIEITRSDNT